MMFLCYHSSSGTVLIAYVHCVYIVYMYMYMYVLSTGGCLQLGTPQNEKVLNYTCECIDLDILTVQRQEPN